MTLLVVANGPPMLVPRLIAECNSRNSLGDRSNCFSLSCLCADKLEQQLSDYVAAIIPPGPFIYAAKYHAPPTIKHPTSQ